jgi:hypothetical protein
MLDQKYAICSGGWDDEKVTWNVSSLLSRTI